MAENNPLTGYEPNDLHISETTDIFIQESSSDGNPLNLHDLEFDDYTIGMALSSPLFTQEREDAASRRQAYHSLDEGLSSSQSSSVGHVGTRRPVFGSLIPNVRENPCRDSENEQIRILLERQKEQILADYQAEIQKHKFQADYDRRSIQKLNEVIEFQRGEIYRAHQGDEQHRRDQQLLHKHLLEQNRDLGAAHEKSLNDMEELTFACWKIRFKTEVCSCSHFPSEAMLWIKDVEVVDSVDDLKSSCSVRGIQMPNFEVLDEKIASALNRTIHNIQFKRTVSLEEQKAQKEDRFLRGRQIAYLIYEYFRVTGANDSVENYADLFYNCSSK